MPQSATSLNISTSDAGLQKPLWKSTPGWPYGPKSAFLVILDITFFSDANKQNIEFMWMTRQRWYLCGRRRGWTITQIFKPGAPTQVWLRAWYQHTKQALVWSTNLLSWCLSRDRDLLLLSLDRDRDLFFFFFGSLETLTMKAVEVKVNWNLGIKICCTKCQEGQS